MNSSVLDFCAFPNRIDDFVYAMLSTLHIDLTSYPHFTFDWYSYSIFLPIFSLLFCWSVLHCSVWRPRELNNVNLQIQLSCGVLVNLCDLFCAYIISLSIWNSLRHHCHKRFNYSKNKIWIYIRWRRDIRKRCELRFFIIQSTFLSSDTYPHPQFCAPPSSEINKQNSISFEKACLNNHRQCSHKQLRVTLALYTSIH